MTPYYADDWLTVYQGDCREVMASMEPESVHCVVTSPPYWGLRDYGTAAWIGGEGLTCPECSGAGETAESIDRDEACGRCSGFGTIACDHAHFLGGNGAASSKQVTSAGTQKYQYRDLCPKCGATRQDAQLGLEPTPEEYVANMVAVFREVRRVLRADGTVWLNLGASYVTAPAGNKSPSGFQQRSAGGQAGALAQWRPDGAGASDRTPSRRPERAPAYGSGGTAQLGSSAPGSAYPDLCDGCRAVQSSRTTDTLPPPLAVEPPPLRTDRDTARSGSGQASPDASPLDAPVSTSRRSSTPPPGPCSHCGNCGACLSVLRSSSRDARECGRKSWLNYPTFKPKDMVPIPWMVAMALQADGWYLRSDIIWAKPNPMPESVTDRPTKAHEYLFLLTKSARYYYDADAVREPHTTPDGMGWAANGKGTRYSTSDYGDHRGAADFSRADGLQAMGGHPAGRNLRSVWTVATQPYPGAHFATFPEKLVEPCVKAGSPPDGTVLDPFGGSGTTARVAQKLGRRAVLIDLNADYLVQAMKRNVDVPLGLDVA